MTEITIRKLRFTKNIENSRFLRLYEKLLSRGKLADEEYVDLLQFALLFREMGDRPVSELGYRIILEYSLATLDYEPLMQIAKANDFTPIVNSIMRNSDTPVAESPLLELIYDAHKENFRLEGSRSEVFGTWGQLHLRDKNKKLSQAVVIAPTSYGKSEMLVAKALSRTDSRVCIIVPTKALISQTVANVRSAAMKKSLRPRVISHAEAYASEDSFIAVFTQERLLRFLSQEATASFDLMLLDEAQNLFNKDDRAVLLAQVIALLRARNESMHAIYYTPFVEDGRNLQLWGRVDKPREDVRTNEKLKVNRYLVVKPGEEVRVYCQYVDRQIETSVTAPIDAIDCILAFSGNHTLVYVSTPRNAQEIARKIASKVRPPQDLELGRVAQALRELVHPKYPLADFVEKGVFYHHGRIPEFLRSYIEGAFKTKSHQVRRLLVCTSTLIEGVNTPADSLIVLSPRRAGTANFSRSGFGNLAGRVGRFDEIFSPQNPRLDLLAPNVAIIETDIWPNRADGLKFLKTVARVGPSETDVVNNPLLSESKNTAGRDAALEELANIEPHSVFNDGTRRIAATDVGKYLFICNVKDFDIIEFEKSIDEAIRSLGGGPQLSDPGRLMELMYSVFFKVVQLSENHRLYRLSAKVKARRFYSMILEWRAQGMSFSEMVNRMLAYWERLEDVLVFVGDSWGDAALSDGGRKAYVRIAEYDLARRVDLAVAKVKEEIDFVTFNLLKYVEVLARLDLVEESLWMKIRYGSDDPAFIRLVRQGFSSEFSKLIVESFSEFSSSLIDEGGGEAGYQLLTRFREQGINAVLVYELESWLGVFGADR